MKVLKAIPEFHKFAAITGFKNVKVEDANTWMRTIQNRTPKDVETQLFNADYVATWEHPFFAAVNALLAFKNGRNVSRSLAVEIALYASAQRQIRKAIELIGVKTGIGNVALVAVGEKPQTVEEAVTKMAEHLGKKIDESVLELSDSKVRIICKAFNIGRAELETVTAKNDSERALVDLVIERMALLATQV